MAKGKRMRGTGYVPNKSVSVEDLDETSQFEDEMEFDDIEGLEILPDGTTALVESISLEIEEVEEDGYEEHFKNLASKLNLEQLYTLGGELIRLYEDDKNSRSGWYEDYKESMHIYKQKDKHQDKRATAGLSTVNHPLFFEAATQFQSRAIVELMPPKGPVNVSIVGKKSQDKVEQAKRVHTYMNYQICHEMCNYEEEFDKLLLMLPFSGSMFKKVSYDEKLRKVTSRMITPDDIVVDYDTDSLEDASRVTHCYSISKNEFLKCVESGYFVNLKSFNKKDKEIAELDDDVFGSYSDKTAENDFLKNLEGRERSSGGNNENRDLIEVHTFLNLPGFEHKNDKGEETGIKLPYIVTIDTETEQVICIRRNWEIDDEHMDKINWFVHYKFLPGFGFYGFGLYHAIGGLQMAATGSLRALLDAGALENTPSGFKMKGARNTSGTSTFKMGEYKEIDVAGMNGAQDISKAMFTVPTKGPSQTLFQLLDYIVQAGQKFANTTEFALGNEGANAPVGTTLSKVESGSRVFSAIHKRIHGSQGKEFKLISMLNSYYLDDEYWFGEDDVVYREDFSSEVDVVPVSDPSIHSSTQRIAQGQALMELAATYPDQYDLKEVNKAMLDALRIPNPDKYLINNEPKRLDAVTENMNMLTGIPSMAFEDQNHQAHIAVHMAFMQDPNFGGNPQAAAMIGPAMMAHIAEHLAFEYKTRVNSQMAQPIGNQYEYNKNKEDEFNGVNPIQDNMITQAAAVMINQNGGLPGGIIPGVGDQQPQEQAAMDPMAIAQMTAQAEADAIRIKTEAEIQKNNAITQNNIKIEEVKAQQDIMQKEREMQFQKELNAAKTQQEMELAKYKAMLDNQIKSEKLAADIRNSELKAQYEGEAKIRSAEQNAKVNAYNNAVQADMKREQMKVDNIKDIIDRKEKKDIEEKVLNEEKEINSTEDKGEE